MYVTTYTSPLGPLTMASNGDALTGLWFEGQKYFAPGRAAWTERADLPLFAQTQAWLDRYFQGHTPSPTEIPLAPQGSAFRQAVWNMLCAIPYGQLTTYGALASRLAERLGKKSMSSQAVGGAVGHNPISLLIPCHRVLGAKGNLTGYAGGIKKKIYLLELEGVDTSAMFIPKKGTAL
ncbi:methylated-DNA--[protein]-cysteine S-methyltransferase [Desulfovibrionales bacterium]